MHATTIDPPLPTAPGTISSNIIAGICDRRLGAQVIVPILQSAAQQGRALTQPYERLSITFNGVPCTRAVVQIYYIVRRSSQRELRL